MFRERYRDAFKGDTRWRKIKVEGGLTYDWNANSTYVQNPPYFEDLTEDTTAQISDIEGARILACSAIPSPRTISARQAPSQKTGRRANISLPKKFPRSNFNSYGSRRGNHEVMMRGTFANIRIKNEMVPGVEGGVTVHHPDGKEMSIYDAAMKYQKEGVPLVVIGGKEYGTGSSRDWAAKGTRSIGGQSRHHRIL